MDYYQGVVVEYIEDAVNDIREKLDLRTVELPDEYFYPSLPLCVIDAVFSIGVRYEAVRRAVAAWRAVHQPHLATPSWPRVA